MTLKKTYSLIAAELEQLDQFLLQSLSSKVTLIEEIGKHVVSNSGKRIRPTITILAAKATGLTDKNFIKLAAVIELLHTATLMHDDVIDRSKKRRGKLTSNSLWGNTAAVLSGDFLYSRCFQILVEINNSAIMDILSYTTNIIAEGEILQLINKKNTVYQLDHFKNIIYKKTAILFEAATLTVIQLSKLDTQKYRTIGEFGKNFGMAYQLIDDVLDYRGDMQKTGKEIGIDLREGKMTVPVFLAFQSSTPSQRKAITQAFESHSDQHLADIQNILQDTNALEQTLDLSKNYIKQAISNLKILPETPYKKALQDLALFCIERST